MTTRGGVQQLREIQGRGRAGAWRGRGPWPTASAFGQRRTWRDRGKREKREKDLNGFKFETFSKFSIETWKTLNTKVVENFELYTFCFRHQFIWDLIQKLIWKPDENTLSVDSSLNSNFLRLLHGNLKIFEHESCFTLKMLLLWFWAKFCLSYVFEIIP